MLNLSRKTNESIVIGDDVFITVVEINGDKVRIGIDAPKSVTVHRQEVYDRTKDSEGMGKPLKNESTHGNTAGGHPDRL